MTALVRRRSLWFRPPRAGDAPTLSSPPYASLVGRPVRSRHPACASVIAVAMVAIAGADAVSVAAPVLPAPIAFYLWMRTDGMLPGRLVSIQALDGIGAGIFGALCFLIIADLTRGSRHNNLALGAIGACWGLGAALSNGVAGLAVDAAGYSTAFIFLACCATIALLTFWLGAPETRTRQGRSTSGSDTLLALVTSD
jgi:hypothetical protein